MVFRALNVEGVCQNAVVETTLSVSLMSSNTFNTWLAQMVVGLALIALSAHLVIVFGSHGWPVFLGCGLVFCIAVAVLFFAECRERPQRMVRQARRTLSFPAPWQLKFDKKIVRAGTVPVAVKRPDGVRFVIDICTSASVSWGTPRDGSGEPPLVNVKGKCLKPDPVPFLVKAARAAAAVPVLWLPGASTPKNLRHPKSNLIVVMGSAHDLRHALRSAEIVRVQRVKGSQRRARAVTMTSDTTIAGVHSF